MKRYIVYILLIFSGFCVSCDEYLETKTYGEILPETTEDYASLIHTHLYNIEASTSDKILGNFNDVLRWECFSDNLNASLSKSVSNSYTPIYVGSYIGSAIYRFNNLFQVVRDANVVLDNVKEKDSALDKKITAVAYTLRAVLYYNMMRELCEPYEKQRATEIMGVPIVDHFDMEAKPGRGNIQETVDFIIEDLKRAISLNQIDEEYIFTVDVAKAYLARTYFWAQDWKNAVATAKELLDKYPLIEGEEYEAMIQSTPPFTTKPGNVILCSYNRGTLSRAFKTRYSTDSRRRPVSLKFAELFKEKEKDIRYKLFFDKTFLNTKRLNMQIRSAEMCLIMAESYAHLQDEDNALLYLNSLRAKRITDYVPLTMSSLPAVDNSALVTVDAEGKALTPLMASILNERRKELYMEGDRWFELKRNGRPEFWVGYNGIKSTTWKYLYTFPLWKQDLRVNPNLVQNEGYE